MKVRLNKKSLKNSRNLIEALLLIRNTYFKKVSTNNLLLTIDPSNMKELERDSKFIKHFSSSVISGSVGRLNGIIVLSKYGLQFKGFPVSREGVIVFLDNGIKVGKWSRLGGVLKGKCSKSPKKTIIEVAFNPSKRKSNFYVYLG